MKHYHQVNNRSWIHHRALVFLLLLFQFVLQTIMQEESNSEFHRKQSPVFIQLSDNTFQLLLILLPVIIAVMITDDETLSI